jgi:hypothetical protein
MAGIRTPPPMTISPRHCGYSWMGFHIHGTRFVCGYRLRGAVCRCLGFLTKARCFLAIRLKRDDFAALILPP